jgi:hypothetical protein
MTRYRDLFPGHADSLGLFFDQAPADIVHIDALGILRDGCERTDDLMLSTYERIIHRQGAIFSPAPGNEHGFHEITPSLRRQSVYQNRPHFNDRNLPAHAFVVTRGPDLARRPAEPHLLLSCHPRSRPVAVAAPPLGRAGTCPERRRRIQPASPTPAHGAPVLFDTKLCQASGPIL